MVHPSGTNLQPAAETYEFSSVPWDITLILLLLINIVGNRAYVSLDDHAVNDMPSINSMRYAQSQRLILQTVSSWFQAWLVDSKQPILGRASEGSLETIKLSG